MSDNQGSLLVWVLFIAKAGVGLGAAVMALLYVYQNNLLYHPNPPNAPKTPEDNPDGYKHPGQWSVRGEYAPPNSAQERIHFEETMVKTSDGQSIHTWLLLQKDSNLPTIIYFHGNACNMGLRLPKAAAFFARIGVNVLMMDYRGYGLSTGIPDEAGLNLDAQAVLDFAVSHPRLKNSEMVLFGDSLGGAVCFSLAHKMTEKVHFIVVENTFSSVSAMVDILFPFVGILKGLVLRIGWNSLKIVPSVTQPILFISGDRDSLVPPSHMQALYAAATNSKGKEFYSIVGGGHNDSFEKAGSLAFCGRVRKFLFGTTEGSASVPTSNEGGDRPKSTTAEILPDVY